MPFPGLRRATAPRALAAAFVVAGCASTHGLAPQDRPTQADSARGQSRASARSPRRTFRATTGGTRSATRNSMRLIDEALAGTPTLAAADARVRQAIAQAGLADSSRKPSLGVGAPVRGPAHSRNRRARAARRQLPGRRPADDELQVRPGFLGRATREMAGGDRPGARRGSRSAGRAPDARVEHRIDLRRACAGTCRTGCRRRRKGARLAPAGSQPTARPGRPRQPVAAAPGRSRRRRCAASRREAAQQHIDAARNALAALLGKGPDRALSHRKADVADGAGAGRAVGVAERTARPSPRRRRRTLAGRGRRTTASTRARPRSTRR